MNRKFLSNNIQAQKGYTLMEVILGVAIVAIVLGLVFSQFNSARNATTAQQVGSEVASIVAQARIWRGGQGDYTGITAAVLVAAGFLDDPTSITGGPITVANVPAPAGTAAPAQVAVTIGGMTQVQCQAAARAIPNGGTATGAALCDAGLLGVSYP